MYMDLHTHTLHSDGSASPLQLLKEAQRNGLTAVSVTDHDSVGAYTDLLNPDIRKEFSGQIIAGTELSAIYGGEIIEVLGYGFDINKMSEFIKNDVTTFISSLPAQSVLYMKAFKKYGVKFTPEFEYLASEKPEILLKDRVAHSQQLYLDDMRKFAQNAKFFESYEHMMTISEKDFSRNYLYNPKSTLYVDLSELFLSLDMAVKKIHEFGGLAFLAHPYIYSQNIIDKFEDIFSNYHLDGIEVFYPTFTKKQTEFLMQKASEKNLFMSGGSDWHGLDIKPNNPMGFGTENQKISFFLSENWIKDINKI